MYTVRWPPARRAMRLGEASGPYRAGKMYGGRDGRRGDRPQACIVAVLTEELVEVVV